MKKKNWYVFYTKSKFEKKIDASLVEKGIESFLPLITVVRRWSDRKKKVEEPLFKSYIFAHVNEKERLEVLQVQGVVKCISFRGRIAIVPDFQIEGIKRLLEHKADSLEVGECFNKGDRVRVITGSLKGLEGIVDMRSDGKRVVFNIDSIGKSIRVKLSIKEVIRILENEQA
jgi:transcription antitermination factor NusG